MHPSYHSRSYHPSEPQVPWTHQPIPSQTYRSRPAYYSQPGAGYPLFRHQGYCREGGRAPSMSAQVNQYSVDHCQPSLSRYSPHFAPFASYNCHCAQCTYHANTGWTDFMNQDIAAPLERQPEPEWQQTFDTKPWLPEQAAPRSIYHPHYRQASPNQALSTAQSDSGTSQSFTSDETEDLSLVAPPDVFPRPSPEPTFSNQSGRSTSNSFHSAVFGSEYEEMPLYSMPNSNGGWSATYAPQGYALLGWAPNTEGFRDNYYVPPFSRNASYGPVQNIPEVPHLTPLEPRYNYQPSSPFPHPNSNPNSSSNYSRSPSPMHQDRRQDQHQDQRQNHQEDPGESHRTTQTEKRDLLLVRWKRSGMSYKDIKAKGKFREAESTLRGRFRALTKRPGERVRKPRWGLPDIKLLCEAVRKLSTPIKTYKIIPSAATSYSTSSTRGQPSSSSSIRGNRAQGRNQQSLLKLKTPWKDVAEYIAQHGGSYRFGNATCRKKWDEVEGLGRKARGGGGGVGGECGRGERGDQDVGSHGVEDMGGEEGDDGGMEAREEDEEGEGVDADYDDEM